MKEDSNAFHRLIYKDLIKLLTIRVSKLSLLFLLYTQQKIQKSFWKYFCLIGPMHYCSETPTSHDILLSIHKLSRITLKGIQ